MEIYERIWQLRKDALKISRDAFGERLGVKRDVIKNIELNTLARPEQKEPLYRLICKEFNVSYEWLTTGQGDMYVESQKAYFDILSAQYGLGEYARKVLDFYGSLDNEQKQSLEILIKEFVYSVVESEAQAAINGDAPPLSVVDMTIARIDAQRAANSEDNHGAESSSVSIPADSDTVGNEEDL